MHFPAYVEVRNPYFSIPKKQKSWNSIRSKCYQELNLTLRSRLKYSTKFRSGLFAGQVETLFHATYRNTFMFMIIIRVECEVSSSKMLAGMELQIFLYHITVNFCFMVVP